MERESAKPPAMKNGIWRDDEGFYAMVDGVERTFSDDQCGAYEIARELKRRNPKSKIQIKDRSTGNKVEMGEDGRTM
jgi:hypothetical protein